MCQCDTIHLSMEDKPEVKPHDFTVVINIEEEKDDAVEVAIEKLEEVDDHLKQDKGTMVNIKEIIKVKRSNEQSVYVSGEPKMYGYGQDQQVYYYVQQQVAGQPVYVQVSA